MHVLRKKEKLFVIQACVSEGQKNNSKSNTKQNKGIRIKQKLKKKTNVWGEKITKGKS